MNAPPGSASRTSWTGLLLSVSASGMFALSAIFAKIIYASGASVLGLLSARYAIATAVLWGYLFLRGRRPRLGRYLLHLVLLGMIGNVGQSLPYFSALARIPASLAGLLVSTTPIYVTILARVVFGEPLRPAKVATLAGALGGVALVLGFSPQPVDLVGVGLVALGAFVASLYIIVSRRLLFDVSPRDFATAAIPATGLAFLVLGLLSGGIRLPTTAVGVGALFGVAIISTVLSTIAWLSAMQHLGASRASLAGAMEPVFIVVYSALILGERLGPMQMLGGAVVLACVVLLRWIR
ncbi:MAG: DMT family transporter [Armatimonadetes bacterium]|nr:DMT family transporter [Armatimonadota bacterium]